MEHGHPERPLTSIGLTQTLPKLHLATYKLKSLSLFNWEKSSEH